MKTLAICALLLVVPLVYGAVVPQPQLDDADLVPDMSVASDGDDVSAKRQLPSFRFINAAQEASASADIDLLPDISVAADAEDNEAFKVDESNAEADADLVPDMSVAADSYDLVADNVDLIPDMSVASDAE